MLNSAMEWNDGSVAPFLPSLPDADLDDSTFFYGYRRSDGQVGIRNELWIIPTVGCVCKLAEHIAERIREKVHENSAIDGVLCLSHPYGCSRLEEDIKRTERVLKSLCQHPNAGGVLLLGLGCEHNQVEQILDEIEDRSRIRGLVCQECVDEEQEAMRLIEELIEQATTFKREAVSVSELNIGVKCGGSDGLSGITANPLVGRVVDNLISHGGSAIMAEIPEMFGAEHVLLRRCASEEVFDQANLMIESMKQYYRNQGVPISENPSPGNKDGGITTLEEKSLGCVQKGGSSPITGVTGYGERISTCGLNIVETPGNDLVSATAIAAAGAQIMLFTTGRGTPMGSIVPTIKISSNTELYEKKKGTWIDFDAGRCLDDIDLGTYDRELWEMILDVASGKQKTCSEKHARQEFAVFQTGVVL